jgi:putative tryptophan/tyrosine transport system substrate-binding protein
MRRRQFIALLGGAVVAGPLASRAQQPVTPVIGFLGSASPDLWANRLLAFHQGLREMGYAEGRTVRLEYRWAEGQYDKLPILAADLVRHQVTVIIAAAGNPTASAAKGATTTIPIVFLLGVDPVEVGLVASLNRPGGNLTGVTVLAAELGPKRLELLHEVVPTTSIIALLVNPTSSFAETETRVVQIAARPLGVQIEVLRASTEREIGAALETLAKLGAGGLLIGGDALFASRQEQLASLVARHAIPAIHHFREFVRAGGLMSYGGRPIDAWRQVGIYTGRILKGDNPADLPVQQSTNVELTINLKAAKALGLTVPPSLIARADEVIE